MNMCNREPDFNNLLDVLKCKVPSRSTLFEFFMNYRLDKRLAGRDITEDTLLGHLKFSVDAYASAGYDYTNMQGCDFGFPTSEKHYNGTISLNEGFVITDEASFEAYKWPDAKNADFSRLEDIKDYLPGNMKLMLSGPGGVLENVTSLVGYDNLCYMVYEEPDLAQAVFDQVGQRLLDYYEIGAQYDSVGFLMSNDDWGFNTQTFLPPDLMRKYVFPWHKKIVEAAHKNGKPCVLHSCGCMNEVMDDIIDDMKYDGKHSYEDNILPVEESYKKWGGRIAILGGIDVDFLINSSEEQIEKRCKAMLALAKDKGGYALGTGNSVPEYIPDEKYFAMVRCAW